MLLILLYRLKVSMQFFDNVKDKFKSDIEKKIAEKKCKKNIDLFGMNKFLSSENNIQTNNVQVLIADSLNKQQLLSSIAKKNIDHILQGDSEALESEVLKICDLYSNPSIHEFDSLQKLKLDSIILKMDFSSFNEKKIISDHLLNCLPSSIEARIGSIVRQVADELLTNALYNAPGVEITNKESFKYNQLQPPSQLQIGLQKNKLKITCIDYFGTLKLKKMIERMLNVISSGYSESMNLGQHSGAGLGSSILLDRAEVLTIIVEPNKCTYFEVEISTHLSNKVREEKLKCIHFIEL